MVDEDKNVTVELDETEDVEEVLPTEEEVSQGDDRLSAAEIEMAKKHKLLADEKQPEKKEDKSAKKEEKKVDEKKGEEKNVELKNKILDPNSEVSEEEEYEGLKDFNANEKAMYFLRKKERRKRQEAERERNEAKVRQELYEKELRVAREEIELLRKPKAQASGDEELDELLNEDGTKKEVQPKDDKKFLTQEDLDKRDKEQEEKRNKQIERAKKLNERLKEQEHELKVRFYPDYDEVTDLAREIISKPDEIFKDNPRMINRVADMVERMTVLAGLALDEEQKYTAADVFYEIGKLHPKNNRNTNQTADGGAQTADEKKGSAIERMLANSQKKGSSASVGGRGGMRNISVYDLTPEQAVKLPYEEWRKVPVSERNKLLGLIK